MTIQEKEDEIWKQKDFIATNFKDLESCVKFLKNPEDEIKNRQTLIKMKDAADSILRAYMEIHDIEAAPED